MTAGSLGLRSTWLQVCLPVISRGSLARMIRSAPDGLIFRPQAPCIVGKASSLESHERVGLISLVLSKDYDAPLHTLSNTVLIDALCRSRAVFSVTLDGNCMLHVERLVLLSRTSRLRMDCSPSRYFGHCAVPICKSSCCLMTRLSSC